MIVNSWQQRAVWVAHFLFDTFRFVSFLTVIFQMRICAVPCASWSPSMPRRPIFMPTRSWIRATGKTTVTGRCSTERIRYPNCMISSVSDGLLVSLFPRQPTVPHSCVGVPPVGCPAENRPSAAMACRRRRRLLISPFLFWGLISRLLVLFIYIECFQNPSLNSSVLLARREAGLFWCLPLVWNLKAVIWFLLSTPQWGTADWN